MFVFFKRKVMKGREDNLKNDCNFLNERILLVRCMNVLNHLSLCYVCLILTIYLFIHVYIHVVAKQVTNLPVAFNTVKDLIKKCYLMLKVGAFLRNCTKIKI